MAVIEKIVRDFLILWATVDPMGVRLRSLQLAGGVILFLFGLQMVFGGFRSSTSAQAEHGHDLAVFPLAVPSIASPGAIMAVILLTDNYTHPIHVQVLTAAILIRVMGMILAAYSLELIMSALGMAGWFPAAP